MAVREIVTIGDPVLRERAREVTPEELRSPEVQGLIDDLIDTRRAANGAGLAANQVGETLRVAVAEVEGTNPRYPYKPPIPLTVMVNPVIEPVDDETFEVNEGCLSVPDLRGYLERRATIRVRYLDRDGNEHEEVRRAASPPGHSSTRSITWTACCSSIAPTPARSPPGSTTSVTSARSSRTRARAIVERYGS